MITPREAVASAIEYKEGAEPAGVMALGNDFVVGFKSDSDFDNLPVLVDGETGEAKSMGTYEYTKVMGELRPVKDDE